MNITQIGRFGMLLMMASVAISCSDPNPLDSYTRVPFEKRKRMTEIVMVTETVPAVCSRKETERTANLI